METVTTDNHAVLCRRRDCMENGNLRPRSHNTIPGLKKEQNRHFEGCVDAMLVRKP